MSFVELDGKRYHYRTSKRTPLDCTAAVCLHGSGANSIVWSYQVSRLSRHYRIIAPDLPGHGESEGETCADAGGYARWLDRFTSALGLSSFFIMGHSFGGAIAQEYARAYPERTKGLVLIGTGPAFRLSKTYRRLHEQGLDLRDPQALAGIQADPELAAFFSAGFSFLQNNSDKTLHDDLMAAGLFDSTPWVASLAVPALVIWGEHDIITARELPEKLAAALPESELHIVKNAGHVVMIDNPADLNGLASAFMEKNR